MLIDERVLVAVAVHGDKSDVLHLTNLLLSMAAFGGAMSKARYVVFACGELAPEVIDLLASYGVQVRKVSATGGGEPVAVHALQWLDQEAGFDVAVALDVRSMVAGDFSAHVVRDCIAARVADERPIAPPEWERAARHIEQDNATDLPPYFDPGLLIVPCDALPALCSDWRDTAARLAQIHTGSADPFVLAAQALSLVLHRFELPVRALPLALGFPLDQPLPSSCLPDAVEPLILRYRELTADGRLPASGHAAPDRAVARVNDLLAALDAGAGAPDRAPAPAARLPRYAAHKRKSIESFLAFSEGGPMPLYPLEVFLEVSNVCNLKCAMCRDFSALNPRRYVALREEERGFLDLQAFAESMDEVLKHTLVVHCFGFGEPTVHPKFRELIEYIAQYEAVIDFFTNGMNLSEELCDFLVENSVGEVTVSFSGASRSDYENVYLGGSFDQVLGGITRLAQAKNRLGRNLPRITINSLSFQHHIDRLPEFVALMAGHGVNHIFVKQLLGEETNPVIAGHIAVNRPWVEGRRLAEAKEVAKRLGIGLCAEQFEHSAVASEEEAQQRRTAFIMGRSEHSTCGTETATVVPISELRALSKSVVPIKPSAREQEPVTALEVPAGNVVELLQIDAPPKPVRSPCMEPFKTFYVRRNGKVKSCCFADGKAPALGDVGRNSGVEIWRGAGYQAVRGAILQGDYQGSCRTCVDIGYGPWSHFIKHVAGNYNVLFERAFGAPFLDPTTQRACAGRQ